MKYNKTASAPKVRIVAELAESLVERVDRWGVPAGQPSRAAAIRSLLEAGLAVKEAQKSAEA